MSAPGSAAWMLDVLGHWSDRRWLRPLDLALARFIADLAPAADAAMLLAVALTAHLEGLGHTCLVVADLCDDPGPDLSWPAAGGDALRHVLRGMPDDESGWRAAFAASGAVRLPADDRGNEPFVLNHGRLYLTRYWRHERRIARAVTARAGVSLPLDEAAARLSIDRLFERRESDGVDAGPDWQKVACAVALRSRIAIVTGGPGTGKTFTAVRILAALLATGGRDLRIALAAPTGKAAARLRQAIAASSAAADDALAAIGPARTLHALLGARRGSRRFRHDASDPLDVDVLLVDEASMIHVEMMDALLDALPSGARLVLIGDENQLASVEAGAVLGELCDARSDRFAPEMARSIQAITGERVETGTAVDRPALASRIVRLRRSERFGAALAGLAQAVQAGGADEVRALLQRADPYEIAWRCPVTPADIAALAIAGHADFLSTIGQAPRSLLVEDHEAWVASVLAAFERFRVLTPLRAGAWGVAGINEAIERALAAPSERTSVSSPAVEWYVGRPIIVTRNDADLGLFNGDVGVVLPASSVDPRLRAWFGDDHGVRSLSIGRLAEVETAFAMTVHRAQGSEFERVVLVVPPDAARTVTRELLYTGITRARRVLTIAAADEAAWIAGIARTTRRSSGLAAMLRAAAASASEIEDQRTAAGP